MKLVAELHRVHERRRQLECLVAGQTRGPRVGVRRSVQERTAMLRDPARQALPIPEAETLDHGRARTSREPAP
jgi:hypothetical protein